MMRLFFGDNNIEVSEWREWRNGGMKGKIDEYVSRMNLILME